MLPTLYQEAMIQHTNFFKREKRKNNNYRQRRLVTRFKEGAGRERIATYLDWSDSLVLFFRSIHDFELSLN